MPQTCPTCSRINPAEALYCYADGSALSAYARQSAAIDSGSASFPVPFVFPSGLTCRTFDQLALACLDNWTLALEMVHTGDLASFFGGLGRADLAQAAREAARFPDQDRGLDQLVAKLPTQAIKPPKLQVEPRQVNLGQLRLGEDHKWEVHLANQGMRLLYGSVACQDCSWLVLGDPPGAPQKLFQFAHEMILPVHVRGQKLRAGNKSLEGRLVIESNGGTATVFVTAEFPIKPFPEGVLAGATSPRQIAEKAKVAAKEAGLLFEQGKVARWYEANGWTYPVQGPPATGLGAVQQFFEALGLTVPPRVEISEKEVNFQGKVGEHLKHTLEIKAQEKRPIYANAVCDQPWLEVSRVLIDGRHGTIRLTIPAVPNRPGEILKAEVTVTANSNQRFVVPVKLAVGARSKVPTDGSILNIVESLSQRGNQYLNSFPEAVPLDGPHTVGRTTVIDYRTSPEISLAEPIKSERWPFWFHLFPIAFLVLALLVTIICDVFTKGQNVAGPGSVEEELIDPSPRIAIRFHDKGDEAIREPSMRFGIVMLKEKDPRNVTNFKRLTYDESGRTNNTCLRLDGNERLFGDNSKISDFNERGRWQSMENPLTSEPNRRERVGLKSTWGYDDKHVLVTQHVEIIPGEQSHLLDTCLIRYVIENKDNRPHLVGLRFMLDTYIGANDGVPFTIPGDHGLCDTMHEFNSQSAIPDFIQALENENLENPGTIAHLRLKLGGQVPTPNRLTLGAWPDGDLDKLANEPRAKAQLTGWDVPVLPMKTLAAKDPKKYAPDSAVVIYWYDKEIAPGASRDLGFAYGLGNVSSGEGQGKLALTVGGSFEPGGEFSVTAYVSNPGVGQTVTITLPEDFQLTEGNLTQTVPPLSPDATNHNSPVTWKVKGPAQEGKYSIKVQSSTGVTQSQPIIIKGARIFD